MDFLQPHIRLSSSHGARCALLPGDPARLERIRRFLEGYEELAFNREFRSAIGSYKGVRVLAMSTGIGGASAAIALEELHRLGVTSMIRIGSCGALQPEVKLGDLVLVCGAVREDGASRMYAEEAFPAVPDVGLLFACAQAAKEGGYPHHIGLARSHDSFYTDQEDELHAHWAKRGVLGSDMETAALYVVGRLRGVACMSILNNVVSCGEDTAGSIGSYVDGEDASMRGEQNEILVALEAFTRAGK